MSERVEPGLDDHVPLALSLRIGGGCENHSRIGLQHLLVIILGSTRPVLYAGTKRPFPRGFLN